MAGCRREACDHQSSLSGDSHVRLYRSFVVAGDLLESLRTRIVVLETDSCQARFLLIIKRVPGYLSVTLFPPRAMRAQVVVLAPSHFGLAAVPSKWGVVLKGSKVPVSAADFVRVRMP